MTTKREQLARLEQSAIQKREAAQKAGDLWESQLAQIRKHILSDEGKVMLAAFEEGYNLLAGQHEAEWAALANEIKHLIDDMPPQQPQPIT